MEAHYVPTSVPPPPVVNTVLSSFQGASGLTSATPPSLPLQGQKRLVLSESCSRDSMSSQPSCTGLNYSYGVNAWKCWVQSKYANGETSKGDELRFGRKYPGKEEGKGRRGRAVIHLKISTCDNDHLRVSCEDGEELQNKGRYYLGF